MKKDYKTFEDFFEENGDSGEEINENATKQQPGTSGAQ